MAGVFAGKTILIVDDEPDLREILKDEFEFVGATMFEAENGQQALALAQKHPFDIIVSDIRMPGGDGLTLAKNIKSQSGHVPVMFLVTGFSDVSPATAYDIGVEGFIYKPFNLGPVIENLTRALLDPEKKWDQVVKSGTIKKLVLPNSFDDLVKNGTISLGRGGLFLRGHYPEFRSQDVVSFELNQGFVFTSIIRWVQHDSDKGTPSGLGMEFFNLSAPAKVAVLDLLRKASPQSYIPSK
jgi:CheY-like chemotaxis protein